MATEHRAPNRQVVAAGWRVKPGLKDRVDAAAAERGLASSFFVGRLLEEALDALLPASEFRLTRPRASVIDPDAPCEFKHPHPEHPCGRRVETGA